MLLRHLLYCKHVENLLTNVWITCKVQKSAGAETSSIYLNRWLHLWNLKGNTKTREDRPHFPYGISCFGSFRTAITEMVSDLIWTLDFFGSQEIWTPKKLGPKKFGLCMKKPCDDFHAGPKFLWN